MEIYRAYRAARTSRLLLATVAALLVSMPVAAKSNAKEPAALCSDTLNESYGAAALDEVSAHQRGGHRSVYADARLANGDKVRFRCLFRSGRVHDVQVYSPAAPGSAKPWAQWTPAEAYRTTP